MSTNSYKSQAIAHELADRFKVRPGLSALKITESVDSAEDPLILLTASGVATTNRAAYTKVESADWPLAQDVLGSNTVFRYTPHVLKLLWEASPAGGFTAADRLELSAQAVAMGCQVKLYESASGAGVVLADIDDETKLKATFDPDAYRPLISSQ